MMKTNYTKERGVAIPDDRQKRNEGNGKYKGMNKDKMIRKAGIVFKGIRV